VYKILLLNEELQTWQNWYLSIKFERLLPPPPPTTTTTMCNMVIITNNKNILSRIYAQAQHTNP
jgi:hypothetical protein